MKHGRKHIITLIILLIICSSLEAQVNFRAVANRDSILIGEPISVTFEAYVPLGSKLNWFVDDSIPHFIITERSAIDTLENIDGKKIAQTLVITSFDSGRWQIPGIEILVDGQSFYCDSIPVKVGFTPFNPEEDYRDIRDIIELVNPSVKYIPFALVVLAIISLAILLYFMLKRKPSQAIAEHVLPVLSPYEEAMTAIKELGNNRQTGGEEKKYYSDLNDILRKYVTRQFGIATFERTNEELILHLSELNFSKDAFISLTQCLRMSDFVKFAKYRPSPLDNEKNLDTVRTSIEILDKKVLSAV